MYFSKNQYFHCNNFYWLPIIAYKSRSKIPVCNTSTLDVVEYLNQFKGKVINTCYTFSLISIYRIYLIYTFLQIRLFDSFTHHLYFMKVTITV